MKSFYFVTVLFVSFILFTACGGESCEGTDCGEPADEISVIDDENVDNEISDSDILVEDTETNDDVTDDTVDSEPDEDVVPIACEEDSECKEICKNFLDFAGYWTIVDMSFTGDVALKLSVEGVECKISVTGKWNFTWQGTEIPLEECAETTNVSYFFYLVGMEGKRMVWYKSSNNEACKSASTSMIVTFEKK